MTTVRNENGFTLIELLVVVMIIGILTAIALPAFAAHRQRAQDADAKSNARNLVSFIESCFNDDDGYVGCSTLLNPGNTGLPIGSALGNVLVASVTAHGYQVTATSQASTGGVNHTFSILHNVGGVYGHSCAVQGEGGCPTSGEW